ncbi:MAG: hypothetical protein ACK5JD_06260 [Mangrovibacterium sp.]
MKKVKDLTVRVTYRVGLGDVDMPEEVYEELAEAYDNGDELDSTRMDYPKAAEWLSDHIREADCMDWEAELEELS